MFPNPMRTIADFQAFHRWLDEQKGWGPDLKLNMVLLAGEVGEVADELRNIFWRPACWNPSWGGAAREAALAEYRENLGFELADCLAYIFKIAQQHGDRPGGGLQGEDGEECSAPVDRAAAGERISSARRSLPVAGGGRLLVYRKMSGRVKENRGTAGR